MVSTGCWSWINIKRSMKSLTKNGICWGYRHHVFWSLKIKRSMESLTKINIYRGCLSWPVKPKNQKIIGVGGAQLMTVIEIKKKLHWNKSHWNKSHRRSSNQIALSLIKSDTVFPKTRCRRRIATGKKFLIVQGHWKEQYWTIVRNFSMYLFFFPY